MAYNKIGLRLLVRAPSGGGCNVWNLQTVDAIADVNTSNYISDGVRQGMRKGDVVYVSIGAALNTAGNLAAGPTSVVMCWVIDVGTGTDTLGVDLTDGLAITATDTD
ncbi:hypothetical protein [Agrobacterium vitis]|uniref:hypothetical protein n=1 Tax=Agrobacterium vitis TaxID=373 RepID=UPI000871E2C6|nr:hypothetical protein [Agrobacterium vitis]MCM2452952.1 hypothetical protein [Agrobacterium vitis]MCM2471111.1 hypothetical protein [Agrobacterium vitis]MUO70104.1 hypothetical protein [Agrobacterium vitis]BCH55990.1 hypothetical protein RvVAR031_36000 [Agrobacterium vitis]